MASSWAVAAWFFVGFFSFVGYCAGAVYGVPFWNLLPLLALSALSIFALFAAGTR